MATVRERQGRRHFTDRKVRLSGPDFSKAWPIGSVFITVAETDPSIQLGFGEWEAFAAGRCLVGLDAGDADFDTIEQEGGAKQHTLTVAEMPAHHHEYTAPAAGDAEETTGTVGGTVTADTEDTGGGDPHNNLQPYIVVRFWKRVA